MYSRRAQRVKTKKQKIFHAKTPAKPPDPLRPVRAGHLRRAPPLLLVETCSLPIEYCPPTLAARHPPPSPAYLCTANCFPDTIRYTAAFARPSGSPAGIVFRWFTIAALAWSDSCPAHSSRFSRSTSADGLPASCCSVVRFSLMSPYLNP